MSIYIVYLVSKEISNALYIVSCIMAQFDIAFTSKDSVYRPVSGSAPHLFCRWWYMAVKHGLWGKLAVIGSSRFMCNYSTAFWVWNCMVRSSMQRSRTQQSYQICLGLSPIGATRSSVIISADFWGSPVSQTLQLSIEAFTGSRPAADWKHTPGHPQKKTGSSRQKLVNKYVKRGFMWRILFENLWCKTLEAPVYPSVPVSSQAWFACCGDCYDPQPVELLWVSGYYYSS